MPIPILSLFLLNLIFMVHLYITFQLLIHPPSTAAPVEQTELWEAFLGRPSNCAFVTKLSEPRSAVCPPRRLHTLSLIYLKFVYLNILKYFYIKLQRQESSHIPHVQFPCFLLTMVTVDKS